MGERKELPLAMPEGIRGRSIVKQVRMRVIGAAGPGPWSDPAVKTLPQAESSAARNIATERTSWAAGLGGGVKGAPLRVSKRRGRRW